ncbi:zinc finger MYND domain-containing protein 10 [Anabrus simplex]|uniref:zinc finger MYND domain-containing protein 10 n=1 Tax=Anabrus simplex TaxID=316456 RepID=UPI0035A3083F
MEVTLQYQFLFFNESLFKVLESLRWNTMPTNTAVNPIPHMLYGIEVGTHCWPVHLLNVQFSQDSSGDVRYMSPGIVVHEWYGVHERLQKLHQQAVLEAGSLREESVKEAFISHTKVSFLVYEAICISVWREEVFPLLLKFEPNPKTAFMPYLILYHEATAIALLEVILFHHDSCEALEETVVDLIDYCAFAVARLEMLSKKLSDDEDIKERSIIEQLQRQQLEIAFDIGIRSISILNYLADKLESLPLSATSRMYATHDVPMLFQHLIITSPWTRKTAKGKIQKYIDGKWQEIEGDDLVKLTRTEGQAWLGIRQLLINPRCAAHYELTEYRRNQFIKLQGYLNDILLDQLSPLIPFKQWICHIAIHNPTKSSDRPIIVEILPQIRNSLLNRKKEEWEIIAKNQAEIIYNADEKELMQVAKSFCSTYDLDVLQALSQDKRNCSFCGDKATKRCSRCKVTWYCGRECQVQHWPSHRSECEAKV